MSPRVLFPLLATGFVALACGPRPHADAPRAQQEVVSEPTAQQRAAARARRAKHDGEIAPALQVTRTEDGVRVALLVANRGNRDIEMHFADGQTHDIVVLDAAGRAVWRWAEGRLFTQAHRTSALAGADTLRIVEEFTPPAGPGAYVAVATLRSTNYPVEQRAEFTLP